MAGYAGHSMSNNAVAAYQGGRRPLSRLTLRHLRDAGWTLTLGFAKWLAQEGHWTTGEYHHTSKEFNRTDFYDPADLVEWWDDLEDAERASLHEQFRLARKKTPAGSADPGIRVSGKYVEFSGSRNHSTPKEREFTGTLRGDWIHLDGGGRKKASGNYIRFRREAT